MKFNRFLLSVIAGFALLNSSVALAATCHELNTLKLKTPDGEMTIKQRLSSLGTHGLSLALVDNYRIKCTFEAGVKNHATNKAVSANTLFQVASISKPVTALAILKLAEQKKLNLSDPVNNHLSSWQLPLKSKQYPVPTIRDLMNHTAGVNVPSFAGYAPDDKLPSRLQILKGESPANSPQVAVTAMPQRNYSYSGGGFTVLEQVVEDTSKMPFKQYMENHILRPFNMLQSTFEQPISVHKQQQIAFGYSNRLPNTGGYFNYPELAAAGLWSTSSDIAKLIIAIQTSRKPNGPLASWSIDEMLVPFEQSMSGLGIVVDDMYFSHTGHNNGYVSMMLGHDKAGYGLAVLTNAEKPQIISEIIRAVGSHYQWEDF